MLPCFCSFKVTDYFYQNVTRTLMMAHSIITCVPRTLFLPHLDINCDLLLNNICTTAWILFVTQKTYFNWLIYWSQEKGNKLQDMGKFIEYYPNCDHFLTKLSQDAATILQYCTVSFSTNYFYLPSDPLLDLSLLFPSFFLLFPDVRELADLLFAFSFKEIFLLTGCEVDPWVAPSCSSSRSNKK